MIFPLATIGAGRIYASAARYPGVLVSSGLGFGGSDDIEGFVRVCLRLVGVTEISSSTSALVEAVVAFGELAGAMICVRGRQETGSVWSSTEKMDRSSPFH